MASRFWGDLMDCEICGSGNAFKSVSVDGSVFFACNDCASFGSEVKQKIPQAKPVFSDSFSGSNSSFDEVNLVEGFGAIVRQVREKKGLSIKEFALELKERESVIHKVEQGKLFPEKVLLSKLERFVGRKLRE